MKNLFLVCLFLFVLITACSSPSLAEPIDLFVSIPPQKWLCDQIGGKLVTSHILLKKGQDPHTFEPTPRQIMALSQTQIFFIVGMVFEKRLSQKLKTNSSHLKIIDTSVTIESLSINPKDHHNSEPHAHTGPDKDIGDHHTHTDPHIWLSPNNLKKMAVTMAKAMMETDPINRSEYERNLHTVTRKLDQLHIAITQELAPFKGASLYFFHPAFGHFLHTYNLKQITVEVEGKKPTPKQLATLITQAKKSGTKVIFIQPQFDQKSGAAIAKAIGGQVVALNPLAEDVETNLLLIAKKIKKSLTHQHKADTQSR